MQTDKNKIENIIFKDVEIPLIVQEKANAALASVRKKAVQNSMEESGMKKETKQRLFKSWTGIAAAAAAVVMLGGGLVFAAINHFWSDGAKEVLEINEDQMETLLENGNVQTFDNADAVTVNGITIRPLELAADRSSALITFLVSGTDDSTESGEELLFESFHVGPEGSISGASGSFYSDRITDENGTEGFEYVMYLQGRMDLDEILLGKHLHIELGNLTLSGGKAEAGKILAEGTWAFDISLPEEDPAITIDTEFPLSGSVYTAGQIIITPLSVQVYYQVNGDVEITRENNNVPWIYGIRMKDGSVIDLTSSLESGYPALNSGPGSFLYDDPEAAAMDDEVRLHPKMAVASAGFSQVINPEEVAEVILQPWGEAYAWGDLPDEIVAEEYGGEIPFERIDVANTEYWYVPLD